MEIEEEEDDTFEFDGATMDFDDILLEIGELGRFQITTYLLICLPVLFAGANSLSYVFTAGIPNYRCIIPSCDNETNPVYNEDWIRHAIPDTDKSTSYTPEHCLRYLYNGTSGTCNLEDFLPGSEQCSKWVFDEERTIVNDWLLTCRENQWKLSMVGNMHFVGIFIGSFLFGILSDRFGRKYIFLISIFLMCGAGVAHVLAPNYIVFLIIACVHAIGTAGVYPLGFVIGVELVGPKKREVTGVVLNFFYAVGEALLGVIAWLVQDWTKLQLIVSAPSLFFLLYFYFIPESIRWLIAKNKHKEATGVIYRAAKVNKVILSKATVESFHEGTRVNGKSDEETPIGPVVKEILHCRVLVLRYLIIFFVWAANAFIYYGMSLNSTSLAGNKYMNFILTCLIEIPGYSLAWVSIVKLGRKNSLMLALLTCALVCGISIFISADLSWLLVTLFLIGKLCITASFGIIYVYTAEIFPTIVRSGGVAMASTFARLGAFLAPFVPLFGLYAEYLPMLLFASIAFLAGVVCCKLPETLNKKLPETTEEAKNI